MAAAGFDSPVPFLFRCCFRFTHDTLLLTTCYGWCAEHAHWLMIISRLVSISRGWGCLQVLVDVAGSSDGSIYGLLSGLVMDGGRIELTKDHGRIDILSTWIYYFCNYLVMYL